MLAVKPENILICGKHAEKTRITDVFHDEGKLLRCKSALQHTAHGLSVASEAGEAKRRLRAYMVKLCDFGSAFLGPAPKKDAPTVSHSLLRGRSARGSSKYACPQVVFLHMAKVAPAEHKATWYTPGAPLTQVAQHGYDPFAADVWSYGVSLFVLSVGRHPFKTASPSDSNYRAFVRATQPEVLVEGDPLLAPHCNAWKMDAVRAGPGGTLPMWTWPRCMSPALRHLVASCLKVRCADRCSIEYVTEHRWFRQPAWLPTTPPTGGSTSNISAFGMPPAAAQREPTGGSAVSGTSAPYMGSASSACGMALSEAGVSMGQASSASRLFMSPEMTGAAQGPPQSPSHSRSHLRTQSGGIVDSNGHYLPPPPAQQLVSPSGSYTSTAGGAGGIALRHPRVSSASAGDNVAAAAAASAAAARLGAEGSMHSAGGGLSPPPAISTTHMVQALKTSSEGRLQAPSALQYFTLAQEGHSPGTSEVSPPPGQHHSASLQSPITVGGPRMHSLQTRSHTGQHTGSGSGARRRAASGTVVVRSSNTGLSVPYPEPGVDYGTHSQSGDDSNSARLGSSASAGRDVSQHSSEVAGPALAAGHQRRISSSSADWARALSTGSHNHTGEAVGLLGEGIRGSMTHKGTSTPKRFIPRSGTVGSDRSHPNERVLPPLVSGGGRIVSTGELPSAPPVVMGHSGGSQFGDHSTPVASSSSSASSPFLPAVQRTAVVASAGGGSASMSNPLRNHNPASRLSATGIQMLEETAACSPAAALPVLLRHTDAPASHVQ